MKTLLISPPREVLIPADWPPTGLCYLAASLKKNNFPVKIIDASDYSWKKLAEEMLKYNPDLVGITCWTIERHKTFETALLVKKVLPKAKIAIGGQHATAFPGHMFIRAKADIVGLGECDETIVEIVRALSVGQNLYQIKGIAFKENEEVVYTASRPPEESLDKIPFPDYSDFNFNKFNGLPETNRLTTVLISSRGCPYRCIFCSASSFRNHRWQSRSAVNVLAEIEELYQKGIRAFCIFDDNFAVEKERVIEICQGIIKQKYDLIWVCGTRVDQVADEEILNWMKKAGCYRIDFGIESGSAKILKNLKKRVTPEQIKTTFKLCHKIGIKPAGYLMVGNPGENRETVEETIKLMKEAKPYHHIQFTAQILYILPNTELYEMVKKQGLIDDNWWLQNDKIPYYLVEYNLKQLHKLKRQLEWGLAKNEGILGACLRYFLVRLYFRFGFFQKLYYFLISHQKKLFQVFFKK